MQKKYLKFIEELRNTKESKQLDSVLTFFQKNGLGDIKVEIKDNKVKIKTGRIEDLSFKFIIENIIKVLIQKTLLKELKLLSETDDVTTFYNQRRLHNDLDQLIANSHKKKTKFSVLFIDVDKFKYVNDKFGHLVGSKMLEEMANIIKSLIRTPYLYRYGGDEFVIFIDNLSLKEVNNIGQRICDEIKNHTFQVNEETKYKLSVSIGICEFPTHADNFNDVIELADKMMYESKKKGRGKVIQYGLNNSEAS